MTLASELSAGAAILERGKELRTIEDVLASARSGSGGLVVIEGEAGIGKSTLLRAAVERASALGLQVLKATGSELEREYPYGVAIGLFEPLLRDRAFSRKALFSGPAAAVEELFEASPELDGRGSGDPFSAIHGLYWLALNATERGPILIEVDDAQTADEASLRFLHYLGQRVGDLPCALLLAFRSGEVAPSEQVAQQLKANPSALQLRLSPLSEAAVGELLTASGEDVEDGDLGRACWEASGGNPFLVTELIVELRDGALHRHGRGARSISSVVPERVARFIDARIARLDPRAHRFAEAVAILGEEANLRRASKLSRLSDDEAGAVVRDLSRAAILSATGSLGFAHPVVRSSVYRQVPDVLRARLHREAASLLYREEAPLGIVAGQLLVAERAGDPLVVTIILEAARQARARGEASVALAQLRRALEEPPAPEQRSEVVLELARAEAAIGDPSAIELYNEALTRSDDPRHRATLLLELGHALVQTANHGAAADAFRRGIAELDDADDPLTHRLEAGLVASAWLAIEPQPGAEQITERVMRDRTLGPGQRELAMSIAFQRSISGIANAEEMVALVHRALREAPIEVLVTEGQMIELATGVLFSTDDLLEEIDLLTRAIDAIQEAGSFAKVGLYSAARAYPEIPTGHLSDAIADAQAGIRAAELGWEAFYPAARAYQALAHIERGELQAAEEDLAVDPARWSARADWLTVLIARGRLSAAQGDPRQAVLELRSAGEFASMAGFRNPGPPDWRSPMAVSLTQLGEHDEARSVAADAVDIARRWGARWPIGTALRAAGIAEGGSAGIDLLKEAVTNLEASPARLELARTHVAMGAALRRHGSLGEAREVLSRGMDLAHRCGALALVTQSQDELRAAGARPRRYVIRGIEALTPAEGRVADLAAAGRTNREIAQALFVTPKAVEYHLANTYRKLGIGSRQELKGALLRSA